MMIVTKILVALIAFVAFVVLFFVADHGRGWEVMAEEADSPQTTRFSTATTETLRSRAAQNPVLSSSASWHGGLCKPVSELLRDTVEAMKPIQHCS